jgi:hypothetical protein
MAGGIVYLDIDDEITTAAARIRDLPERRIALVLPYGSRVATSRINFRLLSRDALVNEKQLAVVAGDSATRALAASAGLPVFASVGEYESSVAESATGGGAPPAAGSGQGGATGTSPPPTPGATPAPDISAPGTTPTSAKRSRRGSAAKSAKPAQEPTAAEPADRPPKSPSGRADARPGLAVAGAPPAGGSGTGGPAAGRVAAGASAGETTAGGAAAGTTLGGTTAGSATVGDETVQVEIPWTPVPETEGSWRPDGPIAAPQADHRVQRRPGTARASRLPIVIVLAALSLVLLVGGVAAYVVLPTVSIVVTPRAEAISLPAITVTADPNATEPDAAARVVPAEMLPLEVTVDDVFPATGKRIEEETAKGTVRFSNLDFLRSNTIPAGSIVSTNAGVRFETVAEVTVPRADLVGLTVFPGRIAVNVTAVEPGTASNVEPNTIVIVPRGEDPQALKVVNPEATAGGTHKEFPQVAQEDVDGAVEQLTTALTAAFEARLVDPSIAPAGATVFGETATLGEPVPTVDLEALVGQEVETFEVGLSATGSVLTVDPGPVSAIADQLIRALVDADHQLVADSIDVKVAAPVVTEGTVTFTATATGEQIRVLDAEALRALVMGKPLAEARAALAPFGEVELTAWPDWVGSVPTIADRVDVRVGEGAAVETPATSGSTS